jgi:hypothetical protein
LRFVPYVGGESKYFGLVPDESFGLCFGFGKDFSAATDDGKSRYSGKRECFGDGETNA